MDEIIELRHLLHRHAELSMHEHETKGILMDFLKTHTSLEIHDCGSWFYCVKKGTTDYMIAFRAEMDALLIDETISLPYGSLTDGVSHKCGHDGHCSVLCGLALNLDKMETEKTVYLIFQPAEEIGIGARECCKIIRQENIKEIYAFHNLNGYPVSSIVYRRGLSQPASKGLSISYIGKTSHASTPEEGNNPTEAIVQTVLYINEEIIKKEHDGLLLVTVVNVSIGNKDFGISAGKGELNITMRAENGWEMEKADRMIKDKVSELCKAYDLQYSFEDIDVFAETRNDAECLNKVLRCAERLNLQTIEMPKLWRASEDFGYFLQECPGAIFYIGTGTDYPGLHTTAYDFNDRIIPTAVNMFTELTK